MNYVDKFFEENKLEKTKTIDGYKYTMPNGAVCEIDTKFKRRLDLDLKSLANAWDLVYAVSGIEGSGKSKGVAATMASYFSHRLKKDFSVHNVVFTPKQFEERVNQSEMGDIILWDEFILGGASFDSMGEVQKTITKMFTIIRSRQLIIILVIPYFHMMSKYYATSRTRALIDAISEDGITRGKAKLYGYSKKRYAYINGKKIQTMDYFKNDFQLRFLDLGDPEITKVPLIDWEEYEAKKRDSISKLEHEQEGDKKSVQAERWKKHYYRLFKYANLEKKQLVKDGIIPKQTIQDLINKMTQDEEQSS